MSYEFPWTFNGEPFESEDIGNYAGFVYIIENKLNGRKYIGRKYFHSLKKPYLKKADREAGKTPRRKKSESNWKEYWGSSEELLTDIEKCGKMYFNRVIFSLHKTKGDVNYEEVKQQFLFNVLESDEWYNNNINGKWHTKPDHIKEERAYNKKLK